ncbi:MAG: DUF742 domain-containing protein [Ilumatobacteraceae bacterium]
MADESPLRIDVPGSHLAPPSGALDDHARHSLDGLLGAGLGHGLGDAVDTHVDPDAHDGGRDGEAEDAGDEDGDGEDDITGRLIRPYAMTGGRTGGDGPEIPLEAQVLASSHAAERIGTYRWEAARLLEMVETPMALVEVAARLEVPVGVARVLVGDLVEDGSLIIHLPPPTSSFTSLLEQVLDGVRDL